MEYPRTLGSFAQSYKIQFLSEAIGFIAADDDNKDELIILCGDLS
jgi:hypothetical protein